MGQQDLLWDLYLSFFSSVLFALFDIVAKVVSTKGIIWGTYEVVANKKLFVNRKFSNCLQQNHVTWSNAES